MSRSVFAKLHRRFGPKLSGSELVRRSHAKQAQFLDAMGFSGPSPSCAHFFPNGIAIVGGGFAGISAAWTLSQFGVASTIFEARAGLGGRVETNRSMLPGRLIETGAELIGLNHPMWLSLARAFGLGMVVLTGEDQYAGAGLETPFRLRGKAVPDQEKLYKQMAFVFQKISDDAKAVSNPFAPWTTRNAAALDATSVADKVMEYARLVPGSRHPMLVDAIEFELGNDHVLP
jgi:monoamine oxidase